MTHDRRKFERLSVNRGVKLRCELTGRYLTGQTVDLSAGGAMIEVAHPSLLVPGQRVRFASEPAQPVIRSDDMLEATVVRCLGIGRRQRVAVQFDQTQLALAA